MTLRRPTAVRRLWPPVLAALVLGASLSPFMLVAADHQVAVVYNLNVGPDSRLVAEHYAERRGVPPDRVIGLRLPRGESMTRAEYRTQLLDPLIEELDSRKLIRFHDLLLPAEEGSPAQVLRVPLAFQIRYLVLCYGVPSRILRDDTLAEPGATNIALQLRRNEAAVDSELALLPAAPRQYRLTGPVSSKYYGAATPGILNPANGLVIVARLDGPSSRVARDLVDRALAAEAEGLWGRAYFDKRNASEGGYRQGDEWIEAAYAVARTNGFECVLDERAEMIPVSQPAFQIALYAGWYGSSLAGPFALPEVDFSPGAIAYHIFSFSARSLRSPSGWVPGLLAKGAAATLGFVEEPYLAGTVDLGILFDRLVNEGWTFGEAAYAAQPTLSWQTVVVGDPLYRPFPRKPEARAAEVSQRPGRWREWAVLQQINQQQVAGTPVATLAAELAAHPAAKDSAVLAQKLGDLAWLEGRTNDTFRFYRASLERKPTPAHRRFLELELARRLGAAGRAAEAVESYERFFRANPAWPGLLDLYKEALPFAGRAGPSTLVAEYERQIKRLSPPSTPTNGTPASTPSPR